MSGQANEDCVGPASETAGKASGCEGCPNQASCASGEGRKASLEEDPVMKAVENRMSQVKNKILVLTGEAEILIQAKNR